MDFHDCITSCWNCRNECQKTFFTHCLEHGGAHVEKKHAQLMLDCIAICQLAADLMTRRSLFYADVCKACAAVCESCAESCETLGGEAMLECALLCRACAHNCREAAAQAG